MLFKASKDARQLCVVAMDMSHNHVNSENCYQFLPKRRKLSQAESVEVATILKTKPKLKILQSYVKELYDKSITLKDLINLKAKSFSQNENVKEVVLKVNCDPGVYI